MSFFDKYYKMLKWYSKMKDRIDRFKNRKSTDLKPLLGVHS